MAEELDRKLVKRISRFSRERDHALKESATVASAINELLSIARKKGSDSGKKEVTAFLRKKLLEADALCKADDFNKIYALVESAEADIQKGDK